MVFVPLAVGFRTRVWMLNVSILCRYVACMLRVDRVVAAQQMFSCGEPFLRVIYGRKKCSFRYASEGETKVSVF